jgi:CHAT domain-containing protein
MLFQDGPLRYVPFGALHDGSRFVIEEFSLAVYTDVSRSNLTFKPTTKRSMSAMGLTRKVEGFAPLPAVRGELEALVKDGAKGLFPGEVYLDERFNARSLQTSLARGHPLLHIASHFVFMPGTEASSFLLLGDGNKLSLKRMKEQKLDFSRVDLLTLSACETALGGRDADGREIEGFGALVQLQGARGVIATLWPVNDQSTGGLMHDLYRIRETGKSKAQALRDAQLQLMRNADYAHPYFWAPFILMGNWL